MLIEGNGQDDENEDARTDSEYDSAFDAPTESLEFSYGEPDSYSLFQAKSLKSIAEHMGWIVSTRKIVYRGVSHFEDQLRKQFQRHMESHLLDGLCSELGIEKTNIQPPYKTDFIQKRTKKQMQKLKAFPEEKIKEALKSYASKLSVEISADISVQPVPQKLLEKLWLSRQAQNLAKKAIQIGWMDFSIPDFLSLDVLIDSYKSFEQQKEEREIIRLRAKLKKDAQFDMPTSSSFDRTNHLSLIEAKEELEQQIFLFEKIQSARKKIAPAHRDEFPLPAFPLKDSIVENYLDEIQSHYNKIQESIVTKKRVFRLLRLAFIVIASVLFSAWQLNLRFELEELSLRSAQIGLPFSFPNFPYTNQKFWDAKRYIEKQEELYPKIQALKSKAAKSGLKRFPLNPPYSNQQYETWQKALDTFRMVRIPAGSSEIGSSYGFVDEQPIFNAVVSRDIFFMDGEVSQALYRAVMNKNPNVRKACLDCPVTNLNWMDAALFSNSLSSLSGLEPCYQISDKQIAWTKGIECLGFRLPTEAEWEYAARAQSNYTYSGAMDSAQVAWFNGNSGYSMQPIRAKKPNDFKLYDMNGSVWEWCWDKYGPYNTGVFQDPIGSIYGENHVIRGGSYLSGLTTVSARAERSPDTIAIDIGFRVVRTAVIGNLPKEEQEEQ